MKARSYPHITHNRNILRGIPIVEGTRTSVRSIAGYYQMGMTVDEILQSLPHLNQAQVHAALAYYYTHQAEIDTDLRAEASLVESMQETFPSPLQEKLRARLNA